MANWFTGDKFTIIWSTSLKGNSLTCGVRKLLENCLGYCAALVDGLVAAHFLLAVSFLDILTNLLVHLVALLDILDHRCVFILCHAGRLVLSLADLIGDLAVFWR